MSLSELTTYGITPERGFLCNYDAAAVPLPAAFDAVCDVARRLPEILPTGTVRKVLEKLPVPTEQDFANLDEPQARMAMVHYSFLVQSYIWGAQPTVAFLPRALAVPMVAVADRLGQQPLLQYSGYVLDNWAMLDPTKGVGLDNIYMIQKFAGGTDEAWFVLIHVAIEAQAGQALALFGPLIAAARADDVATARDLLERIVAVWEGMNAIFHRMPEKCDPYMYFQRVRPYIHGWKDNPALGEGVIYEGVARYGGAHQAFRLQSG
jgi:indoleamine 2,3-dioxygenase